MNRRSFLVSIPAVIAGWYVGKELLKKKPALASCTITVPQHLSKGFKVTTGPTPTLPSCPADGDLMVYGDQSWLYWSGKWERWIDLK